MRTLKVGVAAILLGGLACGGDSTEPTGSTGNTQPPSGPSASVSIRDFSFNAATIRIKPGTQVRWTNDGQANHTTTSDSGMWDSGAIAGNRSGGVYGGGAAGAAGGSFSRTFGQEGEFAYHCSIHPAMKGTVIVAE